MLLAYGFSENQLDATLAAQLMAYTLVHRFIDLPYLLTCFHSPRPICLPDLVKRLWSFC